LSTLPDDPLAALTALARLALTPPGAVSVAQLVEACAILGAALNAEDAYVVRAGDPHYVRIDAPGDPTAYELKQNGYFLLWQELASHPALTGGLFRVAERKVFAPVPLSAGDAATHLAMLLPSDESSAEVLIVRGPWPAGLTAEQVALITVARPLLAGLVSTLLDTQRQARQRQQLLALSAIAGVVTRDQDAAQALPALCTAVAKASRFDWLTLTLFDPALERITARAQNSARHGATDTAAIALEGADHHERTISSARHIARTRRPLLYPRLDLAEHERPLAPAMQRYFARAHILSIATLPLWSQERLIGTLSFSAATPHGFEPDEVQFLTFLCEQAVLAIEWLTVQQELREANAALARAATHDGLTGLPNRALFLDRLAQAIARSMRSEELVAVLFLDLDNFKGVNDTRGHEIGDRLLQTVAERLQRSLRVGETVARFGGDEFTVLLSSVSTETAAWQAAERLRTALQQPVELAGELLTPSASIGVACTRGGDVNPELLLHQADLAMYAAKAQRKERAA
jgi:diguanylate cyclase (GGDEF)-like protein